MCQSKTAEISFVASSRSRSQENFFIPQNDWTKWCHDDSESRSFFALSFVVAYLLLPLLITNKLFY